MASVESISTVESTNKYIRFKVYDQNTATINGLRRTMLNHTECYGFVDEMDPADFKLLTGTKEERRHTVLVDTLSSQAIPILAHRCSRIPIFTSVETEKVLQSTPERKVFFAVCEESDDMLKTIAKPYIQNDHIVKRIYSRDLIPVVLKRDAEASDDEASDDETETDAMTEPLMVYDAEASAAIKAMMDVIFPYNVLIAQMSYGDKLNIILKPLQGIGINNCAWSPCTLSYRYLMDPEWITKGERLFDAKGVLRRKVQGERATRDLFTMNPHTLQPYSRFGKPFGIELMFRYNGKMGHVDAFHRSIKKLHEGLDLFLSHYLKIDTESSVMAKDITHLVSDDEEHNSMVEMLSIPKNTEDKLPNEQLILAGHTMGNILSTKMLEIIDTMIHEDMSIWREVLIAYKIPHPLVKQSVLIIKIPSKLPITHEDLVKQAVAEIKDDLGRLSSLVNEHSAVI
jgi:DNA-directed RNA polymerase subunit L